MFPTEAARPTRRSGSGPKDEHQGRGDVSVIVRRAAADDAAFRHAYRLGHDAGWQIGYRYAYREQDERDRRRMAYMHGLSTSPAYAELEARRWGGRREDFGRPRPGDFRGFGASYEPSDRAPKHREVA